MDGTDTIASAPSRMQRIGPVVSLLLLAPVISEVLYGGTRVSAILVLIPEIMTWGCGALLIRYWARRWHKGWLSMLLLGLALAVAEECIIQQTSVAPLVGSAQRAYGRAFGVNWVYLLWALGYESVWVVLIPVQLTELLFPARRAEPWLGRRGMAIAGAVFMLGSALAWYSWTQMARAKVFHMTPYNHPPPLCILAGLAVIVLLVVAARAIPATRTREAHRLSRSAPSPWLVGIIVCLLGSPWAAFVMLGFGAFPSIPFGWALTAGLAWTVLTFVLIERWSSSRDWDDERRYALAFGGVAACMLGGFVVFEIGGATRVDWIGKTLLNLAALAWLAAFGRKLRRPERSSMLVDI